MANSANAGDWISHPKDYFQPGVLAVSKAGRVLYRWRSTPSRKNVGGAAGRPSAKHVWGKIQPELDAAPDAGDVGLDKTPTLDGPVPYWPFFIGLLIANGWFKGPRFFDQRTGKNPKDSVPRRLRVAAIRLGLFILAWVAAFALLPIWIPAVALTAWAIMITPKIRAINVAFQNVGADEEPDGLPQ